MDYRLKTTWIFYLILFFGYFAIGHLSSFISFQSQVVPVWLPAGIALAGCYLWWWRFFPAVFFGSFIFNTSVTPDFQWHQLLSDLGMQNLLVSCGATLQGIVGASLLRFWLGDPVRQIKAINSLYFVFIVGILVNLISAHIGVFALTQFNPMYDATNYQLNIVFWWLGDSLGVLLATPLILCIANYPKVDANQKKVNQIFIGVIVLLFAIVIAITQFFINNSNSNVDNLIRQEAKVVENSIYRQLNDTVSQLQKLVQFVQHQAELTHADFNQFASELSKQLTSVNVISWNPLIRQQDMARHQQQLSSIYRKSINIHGAPLQAEDPIVYVKYIYPQSINARAIGFNVFSYPDRKIALTTIMKTHQPQATPIIDLVQHQDPVAGFLLFFPVLEQINSATEQNANRMRGVVTAVILAKQLLESAISDKHQQLFFYQVFEQGSSQSFIDNLNNMQATEQLLNAKGFSYPLDVAGQVWLLKFLPNKPYITAQKNREFFTLFMILVLIVITITLSLLLMHSKQLELEQLVKQRTLSLEHAVAEANHANAAKSQFLANMSHEIRTPMNSVIGFSKLAKESDDLAEIKEHIKHIDVSADLLMHIIDNILDLSKIEAEKLTVSQEVFDFHQIFERIYSLFKVTALEKGLDWYFQDNLPQTMRFVGDQTHIEQVLMNLSGNAMKFTKQGEVVCTADLLSSDGQTANIQIRVRDTGIGIAPEKVQDLFQPFTQADQSTSRNFGGTGLGLTIAKKLSQLMGGDITISSIEGQGSVFSFTLTLAVSDQAAATQQTQDSQEKFNEQYGEQHSQQLNKKYSENQEQQPSSGAELSSLTLLIAEDNRINQKLISTVLEKLAIHAVIVDNGAQAIDALAQSTFDAVLMDCQMPVLDGYQATRKIRSIEKFKQLPIIALTADVDVKSKTRALEAGFNHHLAKPINIQELTCVLEEVVVKKSALGTTAD